MKVQHGVSGQKGRQFLIQDPLFKLLVSPHFLLSLAKYLTVSHFKLSMFFHVVSYFLCRRELATFVLAANTENSIFRKERPLGLAPSSHQFYHVTMWGRSKKKRRDRVGRSSDPVSENSAVYATNYTYGLHVVRYRQVALI